MRIYIKTSNKVKFWVPVPLWILNLVTSAWAEGIIKKHMQKEYRQYVECVDFSKLREAVNILKEYKGLVIVDVRAKDGTSVNIRL